MTVVMDEISRWADDLPYWEKAALKKILGGGELEEGDYQQFVQYMLEDAGLVEVAGPRPDLSFTPDGDSPRKDNPPALLVKVTNLQNVNALVGGQTLPFDPEITTVFGDNGSGKSGYARVLGCASFTRGDQDVLPDVMQPAPVDGKPSAEIHLQVGDSLRRIDFTVGDRCPDLASFYVFDSTSVQVLLTKENQISFSPHGLSYLTRLAGVTDKCREHLQRRVESCTNPHQFGGHFAGQTEVSRLIAELNAKTDQAKLKKLATLSPEESARLRELEIRIAKLKSEDVSDRISRLGREVKDQADLIRKLRMAEEGLGEDALEELNSAIKAVLDRDADAKRQGVEQFTSLHLSHTGGNEWSGFVAAAKALADAEGVSRTEAYPAEGDVCLLCHEPLTDKARDLLERLWNFLSAEAQSALEQAKSALKVKRRALVAIDLDCFSDHHAAYRNVQEKAPGLAEELRRYIEAAKKRRDNALAVADALRPIAFGSLPPSVIPSVAAFAERLRADLTTLEASNPEEELVELEASFLELKHRETLSGLLPEVLSHVDKLKWADRAAKAGGSTRHITKKHNDLFKLVVTDRYVDLFQETLKQLDRPLKVRVSTKDRKSEAYKQIVLETQHAAGRAKVSPDKVLSEGEKRAVALADFLTEVALDEDSRGIILDDPVTSLDSQWKEIVARRLVAEGERRQVIIFTHDLHFLFLLKKHADERKVNIATHWIRRGEDGAPGYIFANNSPMLEKSFRKPARAEEWYEKAKKAESPEAKVDMLQQGFGALRSSYEAFVMYDLLAEVVVRFSERVSLGRLKEIIWEPQIVKEVMDKYELLSAYILGHLHSDAYSSQSPSPEKLRQEIDNFRALKKKLNELKRQRSPEVTH